MEVEEEERRIIAVCVELELVFESNEGKPTVSATALIDAIDERPVMFSSIYKDAASELDVSVGSPASVVKQREDVTVYNDGGGAGVAAQIVDDYRLLALAAIGGAAAIVAIGSGIFYWSTQRTPTKPRGEDSVIAEWGAFGKKRGGSDAVILEQVVNPMSSHGRTGRNIDNSTL